MFDPSRRGDRDPDNIAFALPIDILEFFIMRHVEFLPRFVFAKEPFVGWPL